MLYITFSFNSPHKQQLWLFFLFFFRMQEGKGQKIVFSCLVLQPYSIRARKRMQVCLSLLAHVLSTRKSCYFLIATLRSDHYLSMTFPLLTGKPTQISLSKTDNLFAHIIGNSKKTQAGSKNSKDVIRIVLSTFFWFSSQLGFLFIIHDFIPYPHSANLSVQSSVLGAEGGACHLILTWFHWFGLVLVAVPK